MTRQKDRDISILDYLDALQNEYLYFEVKSKIYIQAEEKEYFREVMGFKKQKIEDISTKNSLDNIFNSEEKKKEYNDKFFNEFGNPNRLGKRDWYHYYKIGSDFSYKGDGVNLVSYNLDKNIGVIKYKSGLEEDVSLNDICRIL